MKKYLFLAAIIFIGSCKTVPLSGRRQLNLIPSSQTHALAFDQYSQVLKEENIVTGTQEAQWVKDVGNDIQLAVTKYLNDNKKADLLEGFEWEFNLIKNDEMVNAWAMPGGKVAFYTGIMPICQDKNGVAVVMGHEVAHAIARHGNERMSQGLLTQLGGVALAVAINEKPAETQQLFFAAYGIGTQVGVMLPFSRLHESEADHLGLIFMAIAGYDPREAPAFWTRMASQAGGGAPPEFLSTHPSHETRIKDLNKWMDEALKYYKPN